MQITDSVFILHMDDLKKSFTLKPRSSNASSHIVTINLRGRQPIQSRVQADAIDAESAVLNEGDFTKPFSANNTTPQLTTMHARFSFKVVEREKRQPQEVKSKQLRDLLADSLVALERLEKLHPAN
jgi:hypothetical protein